MADDEELKVPLPQKQMKGTEFVGVFAPYGGAGVTSMALQLAQKYSAQTRCLYLNFEVFDGKVLTDDERNNDIWNANMCRGMSDLIFFLRQRQEKTAVKLQSLIRRIGTIEGIAAVEDYRDLYELSAKDLERLLLVLAEDTEYEKVVFDIGFFGDGSMELLKCMDKLFVPQPATRSQQCKCKSWEALLKKEGLEECLAKMQYVAVNRGRI